ncbi:MAG: hypothetical protein GC185_04510 [Alphaproteobacteria bacterium]|nr:hypothetical protein [Alphaproteobacteria bacterium]
MSVSYKGKSPNALWYGLQHVKAFGKSFSDYGTKTEAQQGAKNVGFMFGSLIGGGLLAGVGAFAVVPLLPSFISLIGIYSAFHFGIKAVRNFANVKNSASHYSYIQEQEQKWLENKSKPSLLQRLKKGLGLGKKADGQKAAEAPKAEGPISKGNVFSGEDSKLGKKGWSFDFNDNAPPGGKPPANDSAPQKPARKWNRKPKSP